MQSGTQLSEAETRLTDGVSRTVLENGLTVLLKENHTSPVAALLVSVRAGYFNEPDAVSGIAHVIEHMIFKGTPARPDGEQFAREIRELGGTLNAATYYEETYYYVVVPSSGYERAFEIQADALQNALLDAAELAKELEVIVQESLQKRDSPMAMLNESLYELAYDSHRIRRWRIGHPEPLRALTRDDLAAFLEATYRPENMVLAIVGDIDTSSALQLVERTWGPVPRGRLQRETSPTEPRREAFRYRRLTGEHTQRLLLFHFPAPPVLDPDAPALLVLSAILSDGRSARLYRRLKEEQQLTNSVWASYETFEQMGLFKIGAECIGDDPLPVEAELWSEIRRIQAEPVTQTELDRVKTRIECSRLYSQEEVYGMARTLATYELLGDYRLSDTFTERLHAVTAEDVGRVARQYLRLEAATLLEYLPAGSPAPERSCQELIAAFAPELGPPDSAPLAAHAPDAVHAGPAASADAPFAVHAAADAGAAARLDAGSGSQVDMRDASGLAAGPEAGGGREPSADVREGIAASEREGGPGALADANAGGAESARDGRPGENTAAEVGPRASERNGGARRHTGGPAGRSRSRSEEARQILLPNGGTLVFKPRRDLPVVSVQAMFHGGKSQESPQTCGLTGLMLKSSLKGTRHLTAEQIANRIEALGSGIGFSPGPDYFGYGFKIRRADVAAAFALFAEVLAHPSFPAEEVEREKQAIYGEIRRQQDSSMSLAYEQFAAAYFGEHPYGLPSIGIEAAIAAQSAASVREWHARLARPGNMVASVVGDLDEAEAVELFAEVWTDAGDGGSEQSTPFAGPQASGERACTKPKKQTAAALGFTGASLVSEDRYVLDVVDEITSAMGGRFFRAVRGENALAYSVSSVHRSRRDAGNFITYTSTAPENEERARDILLAECARLGREPVSEEELRTARATLAGEHIIGTQTFGAQASELAYFALNGLPLDEAERYLSRIRAVTADDIVEASRRFLTPDRYWLGVVRGTGDAG